MTAGVWRRSVAFAAGRRSPGRQAICLSYELYKKHIFNCGLVCPDWTQRRSGLADPFQDRLLCRAHSPPRTILLSCPTSYSAQHRHSQKVESWRLIDIARGKSRLPISRRCDEGSHRLPRGGNRSLAARIEQGDAAFRASLGSQDPREARSSKRVHVRRRNESRRFLAGSWTGAHSPERAWSDEAVATR